MMMPRTAGIAGLLDQADRNHRLLVVGVELGVEEHVELLGARGAVHDLLEGVAKEIDGVVALQEAGILGEDRALLDLLHVLVEGDGAVLAKKLVHLVLQLQEIEVVGFGRARARERAGDRLRDLSERLAGCGDEQRADRGTENDDELSGLDENVQGAVLEEVSSDHSPEDDDESDEREHRSRRGRSSPAAPPSWGFRCVTPKT